MIQIEMIRDDSCSRKLAIVFFFCLLHWLATDKKEKNISE